ncbi:MAG: flagellar hook-length control protein FliK [Phycisphaeraceae bacterium]|nr:flagellar hook-length control protein FliK [Phycisphaeraceae bacterium]
MLAPTLPPIQPDAPPPSATLAPAAQRTRPDAPKSAAPSSTDAKARSTGSGRAENPSPDRPDERSFAASLDRASKRAEPGARENTGPVEPEAQKSAEQDASAQTPSAPAEHSPEPQEPAASVVEPVSGGVPVTEPTVGSDAPIAQVDAPIAPAPSPRTPIQPEQHAEQSESRPTPGAIAAQPDPRGAAGAQTTTGNDNAASPAPSANAGDAKAPRAEDHSQPGATQRASDGSARPSINPEEPTGDARLSAKPEQASSNQKDAPVAAPRAASADASRPLPTDDGARVLPERASEEPDASLPPARPRAGEARLVEDEAAPEVSAQTDRVARPQASERRQAFGAAPTTSEIAPADETDTQRVAARAFPTEGGRTSQSQAEPAPSAPSVAQLQAAGAHSGASTSDERPRDDARQQRQDRAAPAQQATGARDSSAQHAGSQFDLRPGGEIRATPANPAQTNTTLTGSAQGAEPDEAALASVHRGLGVAMKQQGGSVQMRLTPESLGLLKIEMTIARGVVAATLQASTPEARELLGRHIETLRASLEAKGLSVERLSITLAPASHGGSSGQFNGAGSNAHQQGAGQQTTSADPNADHDASGERSRGWFEREQKRYERSREEGATEPDERLFRFRFGLHAIG